MKSSMPGPQTLAQLPNRAFAFLSALGTQGELRRAMSEHGYTQDEHREGWRLLLAASGSETRAESAPGVSLATEAIRALDEWDELGFLKAHGALAYRFPEQAAFVFQDLAATEGPLAVLGVAKFLDRLDALEKGEGRADTHDADTKALELLATRGIGTEERARLRALVVEAQAEPDTKKPSEAVQKESDHAEALEALYGWYAEWSDLARAIVSKRASRITMGLAKRKRAAASQVGMVGGTDSDDAPNAKGAPTALGARSPNAPVG